LSEKNHADRVYAVAQQASAAVSSPIAASWRRCVTVHHLAPEATTPPVHVTETEFTQARERSETIIRATSGEMDRLFQTVGKAGCCVLLTDSNGIALDRRGSVSDDRDFRKLGLWTGTVWTEASAGTNGIGTSLAEERPVLIYRDQHFMSANTKLSCATAPIRDHKGRIAGAIDISTCREDANEMVMSLLAQAVRDCALRIETNLFHMAFPGARIVMVSESANPANALLAVDQDDLILGATRSARQALHIDENHLASGIAASDALREVRGEAPCGSELEDAERAALRRVLARSGGNVSQAANLLGISRATLHRKIRKLSLH